jgi:hypothetical protein
MQIVDSTVYLALSRMLRDSLRYTREYPLQVLRVAWRRTGLRMRDLDQALENFVARGLLKHNRLDGGDRYLLTVKGGVELYREPGASWWQLLHDQWVLERLRRRRHGPAAKAAKIARLRRRNDRAAAQASGSIQVQPAPGDQPAEQRHHG